MKKVIIYCVAEIEARSAVENFLEDDIEIIGYTDTYAYKDPLSIRGGRMFVSPESLVAMQFDYVIIANFNDVSIQNIVKKLLDNGISKEKIVVPYILKPYSREKWQEDLCKKIEGVEVDLYGLVMGMSYSLMGVDTGILRNKWLNISWHSMDFYYNIKLYEYGWQKGVFRQLKKVLFVMPYYYFNYEESQSYHAYKVGEMFSLRGLHDWHNVELMKEEFRDKAYNLILNYEMFGRKLANFYKTQYVICDNTVYAGSDESERVNNNWWKIYDKTIQENIEIFTEFVNTLKTRNVDLEIIIPPYFIRSLNGESRERIEDIKILFFDCMKKVTHRCGINVMVHDYFEVFSDRRELFKDFRHLNATGAEAFSRLINRIGVE